MGVVTPVERFRPVVPNADPPPPRTAPARRVAPLVSRTRQNLKVYRECATEVLAYSERHCCASCLKKQEQTFDLQCYATTRQNSPRHTVDNMCIGCGATAWLVYFETRIACIVYSFTEQGGRVTFSGIHAVLEYRSTAGSALLM